MRETERGEEEKRRREEEEKREEGGEQQQERTLVCLFAFFVWLFELAGFEFKFFGGGCKSPFWESPTCRHTEESSSPPLPRGHCVCLFLSWFFLLPRFFSVFAHVFISPTFPLHLPDFVLRAWTWLSCEYAPSLLLSSSLLPFSSSLLSLLSLLFLELLHGYEEKT